MELTFQRLRQHGVKIKVSKCQLFRRELRYRRRIVSADEFRLDPKNVQAITELVKQRLLEMVAYFRKYISNFSKKAAPLYELLKKTDENNKSFKSSINWKQYHQ